MSLSYEMDKNSYLSAYFLNKISSWILKQYEVFDEFEHID